MRTSRLPAIVAALAASAMALTGCTLFNAVTGGGETTVTSHTDEQVAAGLEPFYKQDVTWKNCGGGMQCAELKAPVDWAKPDGEQITLAIDRHKAAGTSKGSLLINPGGPGGSGFDFAQGFTGSDGVYKNYDIIGFDPRGVGRSTPIVCFTDDADRDEMIYGTYADPYGSDGWQTELAARQKKWVDACAANTGDLLAHIDTTSVARDMDMMRAVLGDKKLNYLGYSFGTYIGTVYAELFPDKVGRMVLDGAVQPPFGTFEELSTQMAGFDSAFKAYMKDCLASGGCPFDGPLQSALAEAHGLILSVDGQNLKSDDGRVLDSATVGTGVALTLYNQGNWFFLTAMFQALQQGDASIAFQAADQYNGRDSSGYADRSLDVYFAVTCAEGTIGTDDVGLLDGLGIMDEKGPYVGGILALDDYVLLEEACSQWPYPRPQFPETFDAQGAPPILVIGTTNDPATPYAQSVALSKELSSGVLITYHGEGHTVYGNGVTCIDNVVDDYFVGDVVPSADPDC
ncbi:MAG TPA: alpha/beta hydrolase [Pseudolysinimonas sp.]|nr:alpha/beta hydrolase [Pseudolysinimonas sp.]